MNGSESKQRYSLFRSPGVASMCVETSGQKELGLQHSGERWLGSEQFRKRWPSQNTSARRGGWATLSKS